MKCTEQNMVSANFITMEVITTYEFHFKEQQLLEQICFKILHKKPLSCVLVIHN